LKIIQVLWQ